MVDLFAAYFRANVLGSITILVILLLRPLLCKAPRNILCILWILATVQLLLPFQLESRFSLQPEQLSASIPVTTVTAPAETSPDEIPSPDVAPGAQDTPVVTIPPVHIEPDSSPVPKPLPGSSTVEATPQTETPKSAVDYRQIIAAVWLGVGLSLLIYAIAAYHILKYKVREAIRCTDGAMESNAISGAFLLGYFRPGIFLPEGLDRQNRSLILAHEQAHIKRGDNWWKLFGLLCVCVHWYNPLVWVGYTLLCRDIEIACDEQVIEAMALDERKAYALALLNSEKRMSGLFVYPVAFGEISLKQRIKSILSYHRPGVVVTVTAVMLTVVVAVCFMTTPISEAPADTRQDTLSTSSPTQSSTSGKPESTEPDETEPGVTQPTVSEPTEPLATQPIEPEPTEPPVTQPIEPEPTEPPVTQPTAPKPTEPQPTQPLVPAITVIAAGEFSDGETQWQVTSDGVLTIGGSWGIAEIIHYPWKEYADDITKIVIEGDLIALPSDAFSDMTEVTSVQLGASVKTIYARAFYGCTSLSNITFPANGQLERIGEYAFAGTGLTSFVSPASLRCIDAYAFSGCNQLHEVVLQGGVEEIKGFAFKDCVSLKRVTAGASIQYMEIAFEGCSALETAYIYAQNHWGLPNCEALQSVTIGGDVTAIRIGWFAGCSSLSEVVITAPVKEIGQLAFADCTSLKTLVLPDTVTEIQVGAFQGSGLTQITFPASLNSLGYNAFAESDLQQIVFQGDYPEELSSYVFEGLTLTIYYPANNETWTADKLQDYGGNVTWIPQ